MVTAETYHMCQCRCNVTFMRKVNYRFFHWEISVSCNTTTVTAPYYPIYSQLSVSGRLREVKNKRKFQTFSSKSSRGRLQELVAYKRFPVLWFGRKRFGILEDRSLRRGGCIRRFDCSTLQLHCKNQIWRKKKQIAIAVKMFFKEKWVLDM